MSHNDQEYKHLICEIGRRIWQRGFCAGNEGNHSVRLGPESFLCTPTGVSKGFMHPDDVLTVNHRGERIRDNANGREPTSEFKLHLAIYAARPDVTAVIHSHPPHATAFAVCNETLPEGIHPEAELFLGTVPTAPYATPGTQAAADVVADLITPQTNTVLMANHGCVCFSNSLTDAYHKLEILDAYCRLLLLARQVGQPRPLTEPQLKELRDLKARNGW